MHTKRLNDFMYLIDLKPRGLEHFSASYVIKGSRAAIVETGPRLTVESLLAGLKEIGIRREKVTYVAVTHIHIDHAGGAGTLLPFLPNARLLVHERGIQHLVAPERLWTASVQVLGDIAKMYGKFQPVPEERMLIAKEGMEIDVGEGAELKVMGMPGHASHELAFYDKTSNGVFPGDAAGIYLKKFDTVIPTTPAPFDLEMAISSLQNLIQMKPSWLYYSHFGSVNEAVNKLKSYATRLKLWGQIVLQGMKNGEDLDIIHKRVSEKDPLSPDLADFLKDHPILSRGVAMQNVRGFVEYFRKSKKYSV